MYTEKCMKDAIQLYVLKTFNNLFIVGNFDI